MKTVEKSHICERVSNSPTARYPSESSIRPLEDMKNSSTLKKYPMNVLNSFYQQLPVITATLHNAYFLYDCLFSTFLSSTPWLALTYYICTLPSTFAANFSNYNWIWLAKINVCLSVLNFSKIVYLGQLI